MSNERMKITINSQTGETGGISYWVETFSKLWQGGSQNVNEFMDILSKDVRLIAPGLKSTKGRKDGLIAFQKTFNVLPDLTGKVLRWSFSENTLFIEILFSASIGGKLVEWYNVDRFLFKDGLAIERVAFYNPNKVRRAFLKNPSGWIQLIKRLRTGL